MVNEMVRLDVMSELGIAIYQCREATSMYRDEAALVKESSSLEATVQC